MNFDRVGRVYVIMQKVPIKTTLCICNKNLIDFVTSLMEYLRKLIKKENSLKNKLLYYYSFFVLNMSFISTLFFAQILPIISSL